MLGMQGHTNKSTCQLSPHFSTHTQEKKKKGKNSSLGDPHLFAGSPT